MANWVDNELALQGDPEQISAFVRTVISYDQSYGRAPGLTQFMESNNPFPSPAELASGVTEAKLTVLQSQTIYGFESAWSPPIPFLVGVSRYFPRVVFHLTYFCAGGDMMEGETIVCRGEVFCSRRWPIVC